MMLSLSLSVLQERIRRMQSVFNRERNKFRGGFENWKENDPNAHQYHQQYQRNDWYWKAESTFRNQRTNNHQEPPKQTRVYPLSHHYSVLGLSRLCFLFFYFFYYKKKNKMLTHDDIWIISLFRRLRAFEIVESPLWVTFGFVLRLGSVSVSS